jgi:seryl-tRNA synthetase
MLDINLIREKPDLVRKALRDRQADPAPVDSILQADEKRRTLLIEVEAQRGLKGDQ